MNRLSTIVAVVLLVGCDKSSQSPSPSAPPPAAPAPDTPTAPGHGGAIVELGSAKSGDYTIRASRDTGEIKPGGDAPIDVWITVADRRPAIVAGVRFWIGAEDAKVSRKAKASVENKDELNHWHTHVEVPTKLSDDFKLWVEIDVGSKSPPLKVSFDLML